MIRKQMIIAICDDCGVTDKFYYISDMSVLGWAIARNRVNCYCPKCAPLHRHTGCKGSKKMVYILPTINIEGTTYD